MAGYIQNNLVEINQATSEEAKSNNDENPAEFTNTFSDVISLEPGDKVSLQSSFIAERGSGNTKTIELKGKSLGTTKNFLFTALINQKILYPEKTIEFKTYQQAEVSRELFDNKATFVLSYYKNMNGTGYVACPRAYIDLGSLISDLSHGIQTWQVVDSQANGYISPVPSFDFMLYGDHYIEQFSKFVKIKNDNSKYTIFVAESNLYDGSGQEGPICVHTELQENPVDDWTMAPEFKQYYHYRELQEIEVPAGFNSADYVAGELSRQLQQVKSQTDLIFRGNNASTQENNLTSDTPLTRIIESTTYKTFPCATELSLNVSEYDSARNGSSSRWWNAWGCIAIKRPELYISGDLVNMNASVVDGVVSTIQDRLLGSRVAVEWNNASATQDTPFVVNIPYNSRNLLYLKNYLDAQILYPEVYDSFNENISQVYGGNTGTYFTGNNDINGSNTRYFMMNQISNASQIEIDPTGQTAQWIYDRTSLGSSHYRGAHAGTNAEQRYSKLLLIYHKESDKDTFYENPKPDQYSYGCFKKTSVEIDGVDVDLVSIFPKHDSSPTLDMPTWFLDSGVVEVGRKFGYDLHWTAPTTCAITLYNGMRTFPNYYGRNGNCQLNLPNYESTPATAQNGTGLTVYNTPLNKTAGTYTQGQLFNLRYVGADDPKINFDGEHFSITQLHTAENLGNRSANGGRYANYNTTAAVIYSKADVNEDATSAVYKINPLEDINEFCPALMPYRGQAFVFTVNGSTGAGKQTINDWNTNYEQYQVYDSKSGIFLEDMGYTEDTWEDGLWGIMGFSYEQFNGTLNNRQLRVDSNNIQSLKYPTTNAEIVTTDTKSWVVNDNGIPLYTDNIPAPFSLAYYSEGASGSPPAYTGKNYQLFPEIVQKTTSTQLVADNFPRSMLRGYYTIRSDIIADSLFVGGQSNITNMPIVGVVTKENPQNDYYFGTGDVDFTIGKPTKLSSIRVSIHDPNGSYANVNKNSSVIFKIQRQMNVSFNIAEEILQSEKGKKKSNL